jgi:hypothetical protein
MEWIALFIVICVGLIYFLPDLLVIPVSWGFAGMMEPSKSHRFVSRGIALALFGPLLIGGLILLAWLFSWLGLTLAAGATVMAAVLTFFAWIISGIVVGVKKSRHDAEGPAVDKERASE